MPKAAPNYLWSSATEHLGIHNQSLQAVLPLPPAPTHLRVELPPVPRVGSPPGCCASSFPLPTAGDCSVCLGSRRGPEHKQLPFYPCTVFATVPFLRARHCSPHLHACPSHTHGWRFADLPMDWSVFRQRCRCPVHAHACSLSFWQ